MLRVSDSHAALYSPVPPSFWEQKGGETRWSSAQEPAKSIGRRLGTGTCGGGRRPLHWPFPFLHPVLSVVLGGLGKDTWVFSCLSVGHGYQQAVARVTACVLGWPLGFIKLRIVRRRDEAKEPIPREAHANSGESVWFPPKKCGVAFRFWVTTWEAPPTRRPSPRHFHSPRDSLLSDVADCLSCFPKDIPRPPLLVLAAPRLVRRAADRHAQPKQKKNQPPV